MPKPGVDKNRKQQSAVHGCDGHNPVSPGPTDVPSPIRPRQPSTAHSVLSHLETRHHPRLQSPCGGPRFVKYHGINVTILLALSSIAATSPYGRHTASALALWDARPIRNLHGQAHQHRRQIATATGNRHPATAIPQTCTPHTATTKQNNTPLSVYGPQTAANLSRFMHNGLIPWNHDQPHHLA